MDFSLTEESFILSIYPSGSTIEEVVSYRPGYLPLPVRITIACPNGAKEYCVLKVGKSIETIQREADVYNAVITMGLHVPKVLNGPIEVEGRPLVLISEVPGYSLPWLGEISLADADRTCRLLIDGIRRLHELTQSLANHPAGDTLPVITLQSELDSIIASESPWLSESPLFMQAVSRLSDILGKIDDPYLNIRFSNGDYNPLNFLTDGVVLTGWIDFEHACFEDHLIGLAKFMIWSIDAHGWGNGIKCGLIERYLYTNDIQRKEFSVRLLLRCLTHLINEIAFDDKDSAYRAHILRLIIENLE